MVDPSATSLPQLVFAVPPGVHVLDLTSAVQVYWRNLRAILASTAVKGQPHYFYLSKLILLRQLMLGRLKSYPQVARALLLISMACLSLTGEVAGLDNRQLAVV